jgi:hypothetical protein
MMIFLPLSIWYRGRALRISHMLRFLAQRDPQLSHASCRPSSDSVGNLGAIRFWGVGARYDHDKAVCHLVSVWWQLLAYAPDAEH